MSTPAQSGSDDLAGEVESPAVPRVRPAPDQEADTASKVADNSVTTIMPVIAPWPRRGEEPPAPPRLALPPAPVPAADPVPWPDLPVVPTGVIGTHVVVPELTEISRPGPLVDAEDSWDEPPPSSAVDGRSGRPPSRRLWIAVLGVLMGLGAIVAVPFALSSKPSTETEAAPNQLPTELDVPPSGFVPDPVLTTPLPATMPTGHVATPVPTTARIPNPPPNTTQAAQANSATTPPAPFAPLTVEAESGVVTGSAWVWDGYPTTASGGLIVRNLGNWGGTPGTVTLNEIVFPTSATYLLTIYFVHPNGEVNRSALVTVSDVPSVTVNFTAPSADCCFTQTVTINVPAGAHSIKFDNPTDHAPSLDKIVISRVGS